MTHTHKYNVGLIYIIYISTKRNNRRWDENKLSHFYGEWHRSLFTHQKPLMHFLVICCCCYCCCFLDAAHLVGHFANCKLCRVVLTNVYHLSLLLHLGYWITSAQCFVFLFFFTYCWSNCLYLSLSLFLLHIVVVDADGEWEWWFICTTIIFIHLFISKFNGQFMVTLDRWLYFISQLASYAFRLGILLLFILLFII